MDTEIELFEDYARVEYPVRGIWDAKKAWEIVDIRSGKVLLKIPKSEDDHFSAFLDGDHFLTRDDNIISISGGMKEGTKLPKSVMVKPVPELKKFDTYHPLCLPVPEEYAYSIMSKSTLTELAVEVFDPSRLVKQVAFRGGRRLLVMNWEKKTLKKDHSFTFNVEIERLIGIPLKGSGSQKIGVLFKWTLIIYDVVKQTRVARIPTEGSDFLVLPNGDLGAFYNTSLVNVSRLLERRKMKSQKRGKIPPIDEFSHDDLEKSAIAKLPEAKGYVVLRGEKKDQFHVITYEMDKPSTVTNTIDGKTREVLIGGKPIEPGGDLAHFCLHNNDLAVLEEIKEAPEQGIASSDVVARSEEAPKESEAEENNERKMTIIDLEGRVKQTLVMHNGVISNSIFHLQGDLYVVHTFKRWQLVEYNEGKCSEGVEVMTKDFAPASQKQKKILSCSLIELFRQVGTPIPKELVGIVAGFI